jgi:polyhydroxyalkanoate synthase
MIDNFLVEFKPWSCEFEVVHKDWLFSLMHFKGKPKYKVPVLISYAYINRPFIMDLYEEVSVVRRLIGAGLDVWMIDWGYPKRSDKFFKIKDYIDYIDFCVDFIRDKKRVSSITIHGYCLGATLGVIYSALNPEKVKNLVLQAAPINFHTENTITLWAMHINPVKISRALGNMPGELLNISFLLVEPVKLGLKYLNVIDNIENKKLIKDFFYMDHWIFDSPAVPGYVYEEQISKWYHRNELIKGEYELNGKKVDLSNITMPVLAIVAEKDNLTPPETTLPFLEKIPSKDKKLLISDKGHVGLTVSRSSHKKIWPEAVDWIVKRS